MIVPQYWAEGRVQHRKAGKQVTVRRFGWSDASQAEAQTNADQRTEEALQNLLSGAKLPRREPKIPYNGADGVPIREEILDQRGETIITRNSYGAQCLNTPNVFFADIDFDKRSEESWTIVIALALLGIAVTAGIFTRSIATGIIMAVIAIFLCEKIGRFIHRFKEKNPEEDLRISRDRIQKLIDKNPAWNLRIYRTPAGLRVLVTHQLFDPGDPAVSECFKELRTDPVYRQMCLRQKCFRARVSPKPWRIGIGDHMRPRPGTWPVKEQHMPVRNAWLARYEAAAGSFASCTLIESLGSGVIHPEVLPVQVWHDELSRATSQLPIA
ncbi:MAG: hypothetical protein ABIS50_02815 [Luteolibacter sp.]|uniref:hypothetical protein n=1 Tax=Luteolibacter sp. TaxID=1962973 RepID=UPI00326401D3